VTLLIGISIISSFPYSPGGGGKSFHEEGLVKVALNRGEHVCSNQVFIEIDIDMAAPSFAKLALRFDHYLFLLCLQFKGRFKFCLGEIEIDDCSLNGEVWDQGKYREYFYSKLGFVFRW
jgi:hypothetical protein